MELLPVYRICVFVPVECAQRVIDGVCAVDDLRIGNYAHVAWISAAGSEQFRPLDGAHPTLGAQGELTRSASVRVEFCIARDEARLRRVIDAGIRPNHPWEVPAIFVDASLLPLP
jgi:hypothetical protein